MMPDPTYTYKTFRPVFQFQSEISFPAYSLQFEGLTLIMLDMERAYRSLILSYLRMFPCVAIIGVRQCGKTTLLKSVARGWKQYDLEMRADFEVISRDPDTFFRLNPRQVALDEAQLAPQVFSALRVAIDENRAEKGRFIVTGSSSPELIKSISESLAGRVGMIELAPFSWEEVTGASGGDSVLQRMMDHRARAVDLTEGLKPRGDLELAYDFWFRGGFPEPWLNPGQEYHKHWIEQYLQTYLYRDVKRMFPALDELRYRRFTEMLGGLSGRILNYAEVARGLAVSQPTAKDYFEIAHGTFIWRRIPAFTRNVLKRVVRHPRGYLRDSGLLHALLRIPDADALLSHPQMGASWEGMIIEEIIRQLNSKGKGFDYSYYRTGGGAEVDLVLEGDFGLVAIEIKHSSVISSRDLSGLRNFISEQKARFGLIINNDSRPRIYEDNLVGIPFNWL